MQPAIPPVELSVTIQELAPVHAACLDYQPGAAPGEMHQQIGVCFQRVQAWLREQGYDPFTLLHIGVPRLSGEQLQSYACCVEVPRQALHSPAPIYLQDLPGGRYAVLSMAKDPAVIGASIGRLYQEYIPAQRLKIDAARPTYEIYYESTMEYCVPLVAA